MILQGDCLQVLSTMDEKIIQTCVTSPPYYGLRDYGTATWECGADASCDHVGPSRAQGGEAARPKSDTMTIPYKSVCGKCGAVRVDSQIGLEDTPEAYVEKLVAVFREVRRVLRDDGTCWINLGDSYCNTNGYARASKEYQREGRNNMPANDRDLTVLHNAGYKTKDLIGIPWMVAFALRADGWYLRSDIIWAKPNPMPESVTDRPTKSHEYMFLLSKSAAYYYDAAAILEPYTSIPEKPRNKNKERYNAAFSGGRFSEGERDYYLSGGRNKRTVWTVPTKPYKGAHFATFPEKLIEPCILAGSRVGDIVLDPFSGSGVTGSMAIKHHRDYIGIELNPDYIKLSEKRFRQTQYSLI